MVEVGVVHVPEGRKLFPEMTVLDNLLIGGYPTTARAQRPRRLEQVFTIFPKLAERRRQLAGTLSGGEQQMVAIGRGLMAGCHHPVAPQAAPAPGARPPARE